MYSTLKTQLYFIVAYSYNDANCCLLIDYMENLRECWRKLWKWTTLYSLIRRLRNPETSHPNNIINYTIVHCSYRGTKMSPQTFVNALCFLYILQYSVVGSTELNNDYELFGKVEGKATTTPITLYKVSGLIQCSIICNREGCCGFSLHESDCALTTDEMVLPIGEWNIFTPLGRNLHNINYASSGKQFM